VYRDHPCCGRHGRRAGYCDDCRGRREITGIVPPYYYAQIQFQLHTCLLDRCDFLECNIVEYSEREYIEDNDKDSIEDYVCFLPLIFFRQDINISKLIYNFYKKLTSLVDEEQFMETIYSHVNKYDDGSLIEHHESLLKELNNK
jgi:hypothetical protein